MVRPVYDESLIPPYSQEQKSFSKSSSSLPLIMGIGTALLLIGLGVSAVWLRNNRSELLEAEWLESRTRGTSPIRSPEWGNGIQY